MNRIANLNFLFKLHGKKYISIAEFYVFEINRQILMSKIYFYKERSAENGFYRFSISLIVQKLIKLKVNIIL